MSAELARKRPATIIRSEPLPARRPAPGLTAVARTVPRPAPVRAWRPDLWPWHVWAPPIAAAGAFLAFVLIGLAGWIAHTL